MAAASNITLLNSSYEPFGAGVRFQLFVPTVRLVDKGIRYVGKDRYGEADTEISSFKEVLDVTHNFANQARGKDRLHAVIRAPFVEEVAAVDTVVDVSTIDINVAFSRRLPREIKRRMYYQALYLVQNAVTQAAVLDGDVPI